MGRGQVVGRMHGWGGLDWGMLERLLVLVGRSTVGAVVGGHVRLGVGCVVMGRRRPVGRDLWVALDVPNNSVLGATTTTEAADKYGNEDEKDEKK